MHTPTLRTTLIVALALAAALLLPCAHAQTPPDATPPDTAPGVAASDTATPPPPAPPMTPDAGTTPDTTAPTAVPVTAVPASSSDDEDKPRSRRFRIGPQIGVYLPTDSKTRDRFGDTWLSLGLGLGPIERLATKGHLAIDVALQYQQHSGNHVLLIPLGVGYRQPLTHNPDAKNVPYIGVTGDLYLADVRSQPDNVGSGLRSAAGGSVILGVNFGDSGNLQARYQFVSHIQSFDFSGLSLTAGYRF